MRQKMNRSTFWIAGCLLAIGVVFPRVAVSQGADGSLAGKSSKKVKAAVAAFYSQQLLQVCRDLLKKATTDEERAKAKTKAREVMSKYFDQELKRREQELETIEARVKKLREHFEKRRSSKEGILDLQLKIIEHEADGLGFLSSSDSTVNPGALFPQLGGDPEAQLGADPFANSPSGKKGRHSRNPASDRDPFAP